MNLERFRQIVESYGANPHHWPATEIETANQFLETSSAAQALLEDAKHTDRLLDQTNINIEAAMLQRIRNGIEAELKIAGSSEQTTDPIQRFLTWFMPERSSSNPMSWKSYTRPAFAACLPLLLGISIGLNVSMEDDLAFDSDEEVLLLALSPETQEWSFE